METGQLMKYHGSSYGRVEIAEVFGFGQSALDRYI